jgi:tetratricopeptide (TPR) repeat protein
VLKNRTGPQLRLLRNDLEGIGDSLFLRLRGTQSNLDAIGAVVTVEADGLRQTKFVSAGSGFASQHTKELCFGLGSGRQTVTVLVRWPLGATSKFQHVPVNRRVELVEGRPDFTAKAYRVIPVKATQPPSQVAPETTISTWLIAPLFGPDLKLPDQHGTVHQLSALRGRPVLVTFVNAGCSGDLSQLAVLRASEKTINAGGLVMLAVMVGAAPADSQSPQDALKASLGFTYPVLLADERSFAAWNIQFRYLFDRRHDMPFPTSFLLDESGAIVRIYQGTVDPDRVLADLVSAPTTPQARVARALPFAGPYFGNPLTRDYFTYGIAFVEYGYMDEAQAAFEQVIAINPQHPGAYFNLGTVMMMKQQYATAEGALRSAVQANPKDWDAWNNLGMIAGQQARYDEALAAFRESALANPNYLVAVENMMKIYQYQARPADAQKTLEELIAKAPDNADLHLGLAMALVGQQQLERGRAELDAAIRLRPNFVDAINNLGSVLLLSGDAVGALGQFNRCRQLAPDFDRATLNAALVETRLGHSGQARQILAGFLARHPENAEVRSALERLGPG